MLRAVSVIQSSKIKFLSNPFSKNFSILSRSQVRRILPIKEFPAALRNFILMKFLQHPLLAKRFAELSLDMINRGGLCQQSAETLIKPLTKSFSVGDNISEAVAKAQFFLERDQHLLLDLVEEMIGDAKQRTLVFNKFDRLLDEIKATQIKYLPLKLTGIVSPNLLVKASKDIQLLTVDEKNLLNTEFTRLKKFTEKAVRYNKTLFLDQEYPNQKKAIFNFGFELMSEFNVNYPAVYMTVQATDIDCFELVARIHSLRLTKYPAIKLVNGAYVNWAYDNNCIRMVQSSKARTFIAFVLIAKFCLSSGIHLFLGTHNPILEKLIDDHARKINVDPTKYIKGQLYGFTTQAKPDSMYALFGPPKECIHYSLRRVIEGADSNKAVLTPLTSEGEVRDMIEESCLGEKLTADEISQITAAFRLDLQKIRVDIAKQELYRTLQL